MTKARSALERARQQRNLNNNGKRLQLEAQTRLYYRYHQVMFSTLFGIHFHDFCAIYMRYCALIICVTFIGTSTAGIKSTPSSEGNQSPQLLQQVHPEHSSSPFFIFSLLRFICCSNDRMSRS